MRSDLEPPQGVHGSLRSKTPKMGLRYFGSLWIPTGTVSLTKAQPGSSEPSSWLGLNRGLWTPEQTRT